MKFLVRLLVVILIVFATACTVLYNNPHLIAGTVKSIIESSLSNKVIAVKIGEVELSKDIMLFKGIALGEIASIEKIEVKYSLKELLIKRKLICLMQISNFVMDEIKFNAAGNLTYGSSIKKIEDFDVNFVGGGSMLLSSSYKTSFGKPQNLSMKGKVASLPLMLHKAFWGLAPDNDVVIFLKDYISHGYVSGDWSANLDSEFFNSKVLKPENLIGKLILSEVGLRYDPEFPALQKIEADVDMSGTKLNFEVKHAYSGGVALYDGKVMLDWEKGQNSEVIINTKGEGPALDLVAFIPRDTIEDLKKSGIDLTKVTGQMNVDFGMTIPLNPALPNIYDAKVDINNMNLKAFDGKVELSQANLEGAFDGKIISLIGKGKVNGYNSDLNYALTLGLPEEIENNLDVKLIFLPPERKDDHSVNHNFSVVSGKSVVDLNYKSKGKNGQFSAAANLKDVEIFIEKLGIRKAVGRKADLQITSSGEGLAPSRIDLKVTGDDNLHIVGSMNLGGVSRVVSLSQLKYLDTDIKADFTLGSNSLKAVISGAKLDLSKANMANFLEKDANARSTDLQVNIAKIKMKNNIWIDNFIMHISCDPTKCYAGEMDSKIGTQSLRMRLSAAGSSELWEISSTNAGAALKAFGLYDNLKAGSMMLVVNTSRQAVRAGEPIPIVDGHFTLKKFVTTHTPVITKMISFVSLPGMLSSIRKNNNLSFSEMDGDFNYKDGVIKIKDSSAEGPFFNFTMGGSINTKKHTIKLKGSVTPSLFGISTIVRTIPVIGKILSGGGHRRGLLSAPYSVKTKY